MKPLFSGVARATRTLLLSAALALPALAQAAATINLSYSPATINPGDAVTLTISLFNDNKVNGLSAAAVTLSLPSGVVLAANPSPVSTCGFSTTAAPANGTLIQLSGGSVPIATTTTGTCTWTVDVSSTQAGNHPTSIPAGPVGGFTPGGSTVGFSAVDNGSTISNATPATATLAVNSLSVPTGTTSFSPASVKAGEGSTLSLVATNPNTSATLPLTTLTDTLPSGMVLAPTPAATVSCPGGTAGTLTGSPSGTIGGAGGDTALVLSGGVIASNASCTVTIAILAPASTGGSTSTTATNSLASGAIGNTRGLSNAGFSGSLTVSSPLTLSQSFQTSAPNTGEPDLLTITLSNGSSANTLAIASFSDVLASTGTLSYGTPSSTCSGGTNGSVAMSANTLILTGAVAAKSGTCVLTVPVAVNSNVQVTSTATTSSPGTVISNAAAGSVVVPASTSTMTAASPVTISQSFGGGTVNAGDPVTLTLTLGNGSSANTLSIGSFTDILSGPGTVSLSSPAISCTGGTAGTIAVSGGTLTVSGAVAARSGSCVITVSAVMALEGTLSSMVTTTSPATVMSNAAAASLVVPANTKTKVISAPISVSQSFASAVTGDIRAGQGTTLTIVISNASASNTATISNFTDNITGTLSVGGNALASQISVTGLSVNCTGSGASGGTPTVSAANVITLAGVTIGKSGSCTLTATVSMSAAGTLSSASTASTGSPAAVIDNPAVQPTLLTVPARSASVPVVSQFTIAQSLSSTSGYLGSALTITVTVYNWSAGAANNVSFTDTLPSTSSVPMLLSSGSALGAGCSGGTLTATAGSASLSWTGGTVAAGSGSAPGSCVITIATSIPATSATGKVYTNSLPASTTVTGTDSGSNPMVNTNADATGTVTTAAALTMTQGVSPASIKQFGTSVLTVTLTNPTATSLTALAFSQTFPANLLIAPSAGLSTTCSGTPVYTATPGTGSFAVQGLSLASGGASCNVKVTVTSAATGTYTPSIAASNVSDAEGQTNSTAASTTLTVTTPLSSVAAFSPASTGLNGSSRATVTVTNNGVQALSNFSITAPLQTGANAFVLSSTPAASTTCAGSPSITAVAGASTTSLSGATLAAGASCAYAFNVSTTSGGNWTLNIPSGNISSAEGAANTAAVTATLTKTTAASIGINKSFSPNSVSGGTAATLQIDLTNPLSSSSTVNATTFTDTFPAGMVIYATPGASTTCTNGVVSAVAGDNKVSLSGADIPVNTTCSVYVSVTSLQPLNLTNLIAANAVSTQQGFTNSVSTSATLSTLQGLGVEKSFSPAAVSPAQVSRLSIQLISTLSSQSLTSVAVTDALPSGVVVAPVPNVSSTCSTAPTPVAGASSIVISGVTLAASTSCTIAVDVVAASVGSYVNTLAIGAATSSQGYANQTAATATLNVLVAPTVTLGFGTNPVQASASSTATITLGNTSSQALNAAALNFSLPSGLAVALTPNASTTCTGGSVVASASGSSIAITGATIPANGSCLFKADVSSNTPASYAATNPIGALSTSVGVSNTAAANSTLVVLQFPTVSQSFSPTSMTAGATTALTLTLGNANATAITLSSSFTDTLPVAPGALVIAASPGLTTTCTANKVTATAGSGSISYASAASIPAGGCTITVNLSTSTAGSYSNAIPAGALATSAGNSQTLSTASLVVVNSPPTATAITNAGIDGAATSAQPLSAMAGTATASGATISSYTVATLPSAGTLYCSAVAISSVPSNCAATGLSYKPTTPTPNPVTFSYTVTDSKGSTSTAATFTIPLLTAPTAAAFSNRVNNNAATPVTIGPMSGTAQSGASISSSTVTVLPANATLYCAAVVISTVPTACANGLKILPVGNPVGSSTLSYIVTDSNGLSSGAATGTINWNAPPSAAAFTSAVNNNAGTAVAIGPMSGTAQSGASISSYTVTALPANATLYCATVVISTVPSACANGLKILPVGNPVGSSTLSYTVTDSNGMSSPAATGTIQWNTPPLANALTNPAISSAAPTPQALSPLSGTVTTSGATLSSYAVASLPGNGTLYCNAVAIGSVPASCGASQLSFLPGTPAVASTSFTYTVSDSNGMVSAAATFTVPMNQGPSASTFSSAVNNNATTPVTIGPMVGTPQSGATISSYTVTALPANATLYCATVVISTVPSACANGLKILPVGNPAGSSTLSYLVTDSNGISSSAAAGTIHWNTPPTANAVTTAAISSAATSPQPLSSLSGTVTTSGATLSSYAVASLPGNGTLYCNAVAIASVPASCGASQLSFLPGTPALASTSFTYTVSDSNGMVSAAATFTVPMNLPPTAAAFSSAVNNNAGTPVTIGPMSGTAQSGASISSYTVTALPANATLYCATVVISTVPSACANGLKILPVGNPGGSSTLSYTVTDTNGLSSASATGTIHWNTAPSAAAFSNTVNSAASTPVTIGPMSGTAQSGASISSLTVTALPANATLYCATVVISAVPAACANSLLILPVGNPTGSSSLSYTATDSNGLTSNAATGTIHWLSSGTPAAQLTMDALPVLTGGAPASFSLHVSNGGTLAAPAGLALRLNLPAGLALQQLSDVSGNWSCARTDGATPLLAVPAAQALLCHLASALPIGAAAPALVVTVVPNFAYIGQTLSAAASVDPAAAGAVPAPGAGCAPASACAQNQGLIQSPGAPIVSIAFAEHLIIQGGQTSLSLTIANPMSSLALSGGHLDLPLPNGLTLVSGAPVQSSCRAVTGSTASALSITALNLGAQQSCQLSWRVSSALPAGTQLTAAVAAGALQDDQGLSNPGSSQDQLLVSGGIDAQLGFSQASAVSGTPVHWLLTIGNGMAVNLGQVAFSHTLPAGLQVAASPNASSTCAGVVSVAGAQISLAGAALASGTSCVIQVDVTAAAVASYVDSLPAGAIAALPAGGLALPASHASSASIQFSQAARVAGLVSKAGVPIGNVRVDLVSASGSVVASVFTGSDGRYNIPGVPASVPGESATSYSLIFTPPGTAAGLVRGLPNASPALAGLSGTADAGAIRSVMLLAGTSTDNQDAVLIDPAGVVYDAVTRQPVAGARVTLFGPDGQAVPDAELDLVAGNSNGTLTQTDGAYALVLRTAPAGIYTLRVTVPQGYAQAADPARTSLLIPAQPGHYTPALGGGMEYIQPQATAPAVGSDTRYFLAFAFVTGATAATTSNGVAHNHLPIDPVTVARGFLSLAKTGSAASAEIGDSLTYTLVLSNGASAPALGVVVHDQLPRGFRYIPGSARAIAADGTQRSGDPAFALQGVGPVLDFKLPDLAAGASLTLTYHVRVGVGAQQGDGVNRAQASAQSGVRSNLAVFAVRVNDGVFTQGGCVIGRVWLDCNRNGVPDGSDEPGIPDVRIYLEDGSWMETDSAGKYSLCGLTANTHVLKVDQTTLPAGVALAVTGNRNAGDAGSLFVDLQAGELFRAEFRSESCTAAVLGEVRRRQAAAGPDRRLEGLDRPLTP